MTISAAVLEREIDSILESPDDVAIDGLQIDSQPDGYRFAVETLERTGLTETDLRRTLSEFPEYVTNRRYWQTTVGGEGTARRAFLRWCEHAPVEGSHVDGDDHDHNHDSGHVLALPERYEALADGIERTWGQLQITTHLADPERGERRYELRHVDDTGEPATALDTQSEPRDAREIVTFDDRDRYRPLKTAPTLVGGWLFTDLTGEQLVETIDFIYPATIANWHREQVGQLDIDHWHETAERQTGIYEVIEELSQEAVDWMAEACCVDSQCLRRREWQYDEDTDLETEGGDGEFPCREPCSLVIAAARKWTILESEDEKTWEMELTTSEKNQLEELIDAVADGRVDEIREADVYDGANRYRARYLRAKRFDEDGELPATEVPSED